MRYSALWLVLRMARSLDQSSYHRNSNVLHLQQRPQPRRLVRRAERRVASWLFPDREQVLRSLERLQADVNAGMNPPEALEETLQDALHDPALRVGYRLPGHTDYVDRHGKPVLQTGAILNIEMAGDRIAVVGQASRVRRSSNATGDDFL